MPNVRPDPGTRCHECGYAVRDAPPGEVVTLAERFPDRLCALFRCADDARLRRRTRPDVWSPVEYAAHVGEAVAWYVARVDRVRTEDRPRLAPFDWDAACAERAYNSRPLDRVVDDVAASCAALAASARAAESGGWLMRSGIGSDGGERTVRELLARAGHEIIHHDLDLRRLTRPDAAPRRG